MKKCQCRPGVQDAVILAILATSFTSLYVLLRLSMIFLEHEEAPDSKAGWIESLIKNLLGYFVVLLPGSLVLLYVKRCGGGSSEGHQTYCLAPLIRFCFFGDGNESSLLPTEDPKAAKKVAAEGSGGGDAKRLVHLVVCCVGLQVTYLSWGVLQEKIMTRRYVNANGDSGLFRNSQFLVFVNRILAFGTALAYITLFSARIPRHAAPFYKYAYCSLSNIMSSWCQYEALKFVSFPTQVLAKASKIIPVMAMGKLVSNKTYEKYEYLVALLISFGMFLFLYGSKETVASVVSPTSSSGGGDDDGAWLTAVSGFILLLGYMASDAFTTNWQNALFTSYKMSPVQAMCGVNLFSCTFTAASLLQQGGFYDSLVFMSQFPNFAFDCVMLSMCSAFGQLLIFDTINAFGPVSFVIIMTIRQLLAILISCLTYGHAITAYGIFGVLVVFGATFFKIYYGYKLKKAKRRSQEVGGGNEPEET